MSTYDFVMKQRALHSESAKSKKPPTEPTKEIEPKPKTRYFSNLKANFFKSFRTNNKIQSGEQDEHKVDKNKELVEKKQNGIDPKPVEGEKKEQTISTISNGISLSNNDQTNHVEPAVKA